MVAYRLGHAARILGVSVDTVRRLADSGKLRTTRTQGGQRLVDGARLAQLAERIDDDPEFGSVSSARNHLLGIVTRVVRDKVAAQVELRCGPFRLVALVTRESVDNLRLQPGVMAYAVVKATNVVVELATEAVTALDADEVSEAALGAGPARKARQPAGRAGARPARKTRAS
jgi:molybdopterin-binding protein